MDNLKWMLTDLEKYQALMPLLPLICRKIFDVMCGAQGWPSPKHLTMESGNDQKRARDWRGRDTPI